MGYALRNATRMSPACTQGRKNACHALSDSPLKRNFVRLTLIFARNARNIARSVSLRPEFKTNSIWTYTAPTIGTSRQRYRGALGAVERITALCGSRDE